MTIDPDSRSTIAALTALRTDAIDHLSYIGTLIHDLEGRNVLTRDDVTLILGGREASPSIRVDPGGDRADDDRGLHTQREHTENSPVIPGESGGGTDMESGRVKPRQQTHNVRRTVARRYGEVMEMLGRNIPTAAQPIRAYVELLLGEASRYRVEAKELRARLGVGDE